jgi:hypothetical protein
LKKTKSKRRKKKSSPTRITSGKFAGRFAKKKRVRKRKVIPRVRRDTRAETDTFRQYVYDMRPFADPLAPKTLAYIRSRFRGLEKARTRTQIYRFLGRWASYQAGSDETPKERTLEAIERGDDLSSTGWFSYDGWDLFLSHYIDAISKSLEGRIDFIIRGIVAVPGTKVYGKGSRKKAK